jgi:hypothetical protein
MTMPAALSEGLRPEVQLLRDFAWIDLNGVNGRTAEVEYRLGCGQLMSMAAGGSGVHSSPDRSPYSFYEVLFDADPPRFWQRYTDSAGMVFANVPRILITHYVVRNGGIEWRDERVIEPKTKALPLLPQGGCFRW